MKTTILAILGLLIATALVTATHVGIEVGLSAQKKQPEVITEDKLVNKSPVEIIDEYRDLNSEVDEYRDLVSTKKSTVRQGESDNKCGFELKPEFQSLWFRLSRGLSVPYTPGMFEYACFN